MTARDALPGQLALDLQSSPRYGRAEFLVADSNRAALAMLDRWPDWPDRALLLLGPPGAGKTHLCHIWAARAVAMMANPDSLPDLTTLTEMAPSAIAVDDIERVTDEPALFHIFNYVVESGAHLLLTAGRAPEARLPDLQSRLRRAPLVELAPPDEALMHAVLDKLFRDRQLVVDAPALAYAALRLERSIDAARAFVDAVDRAALAQGRPVTRALAAEVMQSFSAE